VTHILHPLEAHKSPRAHGQFSRNLILFFIMTADRVGYYELGYDISISIYYFYSDININDSILCMELR
jgi:hypothetical protein